MKYYSYIIGDKLVPGYAPSGIANPDLTWESTTQYDAGLDLGFFSNRITINIDAYYKRTTNLLLDVTLPATSGQYPTPDRRQRAQVIRKSNLMARNGDDIIRLLLLHDDPWAECISR